MIHQYNLIRSKSKNASNISDFKVFIKPNCLLICSTYIYFNIFNKKNVKKLDKTLNLMQKNLQNCAHKGDFITLPDQDMTSLRYST